MKYRKHGERRKEPALAAIASVCIRPLLEPELRDQLHLARAHAGTADAADMTRSDRLIRQGERRVVEQIGGVGAEVQIEPLCESERLVERRVYGAQFRPVYDVSPHVPESAGGWEPQRH